MSSSASNSPFGSINIIESGRVLWRLEISSLVCLMVVAVPFVCIGFPESKANWKFKGGGIEGPGSGGGLTGNGRVVASGLPAEALVLASAADSSSASIKAISSSVCNTLDFALVVLALSVVEERPLDDPVSCPGKAVRQSFR